MKTGKSLEVLAAELTRQAQSKKDFIVDTRQLSMDDTLTVGFPVNDHEERVEVKPLAHRQIATHLGIPQKYYDRLQAEIPGLLSENVNRLLRHQPTQRMVRTMDSGMRAFLSNRYRPIDNYDLAEVVLPVLGDMRGSRVESCEVTENRMYLKVVNERLTMEVKKGDVVQAALPPVACLRSRSSFSAGRSVPSMPSTAPRSTPTPPG